MGKKRGREPKPLHPILASSSGPALIKHLASCNTTVRSQSLRLLQSWLVSDSPPPELSDADMKKIWKGLFYCLWHSDKSPNQVALIDRLTSLFLSLPPTLSLDFFRAFLVTLRREWPGIDRLRLDKFYLMIRRFVKAFFELMRLRNWEVSVLEEYVRVLESDGFLAEDKLQGNGVNYHTVSVFLEELKGVGFPAREEVVYLVLRPFFEVLMKSKDKILAGKVKSYIFDELVKAGKELLEKMRKMEADCDEGDGNVLLGAVALRMGLAGRLYQVGSSVDCIQGNRKVVFGLHEEFVKLEKELESSGLEIAIPEYVNVSVDGGVDDEVPQLIPIDFDANEGMRSEDDAADEKILRKSKKVKREKDGDDKKRKKKKKKKGVEVVSGISLMVEENGDFAGSDDNLQLPIASGNNRIDDPETDGAGETLISNLQRQFEKVAAEMDSDRVSSKHNKRKRTKGLEDTQKQDNQTQSTNGTGENGIDNVTKSVNKSAKKVRFSMKNNLVWKPQNPLPPECLRLPPSVTPRGSALKKGVPPGPVIEMPSLKKKAKAKAKAKKKALNRLKSAKLLAQRRIK